MGLQSLFYTKAHIPSSRRGRFGELFQEEQQKQMQGVKKIEAELYGFSCRRIFRKGAALSVIQKNKHEREQGEQLLELPRRRSREVKGAPAQKIQESEAEGDRIGIVDGKQHSEKEKNDFSFKQIKYHCKENSPGPVIRGEPAEIIERKNQYGRQKGEVFCPAAVSQLVRCPDHEQGDQEGEKHIELAENIAMVEHQRKGDLGEKGEKEQPQRVAKAVGGVAEAVDDQKHIERKSNAADPAERLQKGIASCEAVADVVQKHTYAGNDPQRKSRHIFSSPPFFGYYIRSRDTFQSCMAFGKRRNSAWETAGGFVHNAVFCRKSKRSLDIAAPDL